MKLLHSIVRSGKLCASLSLQRMIVDSHRVLLNQLPLCTLIVHGGPFDSFVLQGGSLGENILDFGKVHHELSDISHIVPGIGNERRRTSR
jgi:hypothetical protein